MPEPMPPVITNTSVDEDAITLQLEDGRTISAPLAWFPTLLAATPEQRAAHVPCAAGTGVSWPALDEDISAAGLLRVA